jgi:nitrate/nitrite-specific signal transduction histidine kinase
MEERANRLGGSLEINSTVGSGTKVLVKVPVKQNKGKPAAMLSDVKA